jgi:thymidylate synthase (FAD)
MKVSLVSYTVDGEKVVAIAAKMSRSRKGWEYHEKSMDKEEMETWIKDSILHGYWSVLEHSVYTFSIEGISRVASHQYVLPNGVNTNLVVTMNARELYNFFGLRLCSRAQWEIRKIAWLMLEEVRRVHPILFRFAGPNCVIHENFVRDENDPVTLEDRKEFVSLRCIEGVPRQGIWKCIKNSRDVVKKDD